MRPFVGPLRLVIYPQADPQIWAPTFHVEGVSGEAVEHTAADAPLGPLGLLLGHHHPAPDPPRGGLAAGFPVRLEGPKKGL